MFLYSLTTLLICFVLSRVFSQVKFVSQFWVRGIIEFKALVAHSSHTYKLLLDRSTHIIRNTIIYFNQIGSLDLFPRDIPFIIGKSLSKLDTFPCNFFHLSGKNKYTKHFKLESILKMGSRIETGHKNGDDEVKTITSFSKRYGSTLFLEAPLTAVKEFWSTENQSSAKIFAYVAIAIGSTLLAVSVYRVLNRRHPTAAHIPGEFFSQKLRRPVTLRGFILGASDSDNVRFYHQSLCQRLCNFGTIRKIYVNRYQGNSDCSKNLQADINSRSSPLAKVGGLKNNKPSTFPSGKSAENKPGKSGKIRIMDDTINVRLAGIDAPEMGHFGGTRQPYALEAKVFLDDLVRGRDAWIDLHRIDQYQRVVASVYVRKFYFWRQNVSLAMIEAGFACIYRSGGAEYGGIYDKLNGAEERAK